ncbi:Max dimerization protein 4 [Dissostichus eleginoides]|nr:Max dimerization protein 4 [Dissostichus eleginoides]
MELNSLLILLEAAEYLERRDREAEHGYASVLPYRDDFSSKKTKASPISRKTQNNRSSHNELEKHRAAPELQTCLISSSIAFDLPHALSRREELQFEP